MSKLFEFFKTKNLERKFSRLGDGHRLGDPPESRSVPQQMPADPPKQVNQSSKSTNKAADAALERLNQQRGKPNSSKYAVRHEVEQALRVQREAEELRERFTQKVVTVEKPTVIARVLFCCPALFASSVIGSRDHVDQAIHNYLIAEAESNFAEAATLILARGLENSKPPTSPDIPLAEQQTASEWREKRQQHFLRILTNLLQSPENPTFRRLRMGNNLVADLLSIDGAEMFFRACGFTKQMLPVQKPAGTSDDDQPGDPPSTEPFLVISEEAAQDAQHLQHMFDLLNTAEPILPELFRDTQVFKTSGNLSGLATRDQLPDEFFYQTKEEVKRSLEQQQRIIEESGMLMTKAMRERLRVQEVRLFRYAVVRVRMPDGLILQGTFYANDPLSKVRAWITDCFAIPSVEYQLWAPPGTVAASRSNLPPTARAELTNDVLTLTEYGLAPCSLITLSIPQASSTDQPVNLLRSDLLANATSL